MIKNILGLERILTGEIEINGLTSQELYSNPAKLHGLIGYQPQIDALDIDLTVIQHLNNFAELAGIHKSNIPARVGDMIKRMCLEDVQNDRAGILSDGYKRRLSLGMALIGRPKIVILDDPLAGVDPATSVKLLSSIRKETEFSTLLVCTQSVDVAEALA